MEIEFKDFLLSEENQYFGAKIGDVLNAVQELTQDSKNLGARQLTRLSESIVNQIRQILRSRWSTKQRAHLERLQCVGVALMKAVESKGEDLPAVLASVQHELETLSGKIGTPLNQMGAGLAENVLFG